MYVTGKMALTSGERLGPYDVLAREGFAYRFERGAGLPLDAIFAMAGNEAVKVDLA